MVDLLAAVRAQAKMQGLTLIKDERLGNDTGHQLRFREGPIVNFFDNGTCTVQGRNQDSLGSDIQGMLGLGISSGTATTRKVFVVYGHDDDARNQLEMLLRRWHLEPLILDRLPSDGQTIIEKLERYKGDACYAVILATPDDEGYARGKPDEAAFRARQNVVLELGMMLAHLGRSKVAILLKDSKSMERPSDIQGLVYMSFLESVDEIAVPLAKEMQNQGISIDVRDL